MGIITSTAFALSQLTNLSAGMPIIAWKSVVTFDNITVDSEVADYPATNITNPATNLKWVSASTAEQFVTTLFTSSDKIEYAAVARHNFGSGQISVTVEGLPIGADANVDGDWVVLVAEQLLADDTPALFRFDAEYYDGVRLRLTPDATAPTVAIFFVGPLLVLQRGIPAGHTPINFGRTVKKTAVSAQSGDFLGEVILAAGLKSSIVQQKIEPDWYRANLEPFRLASPGLTFFWAWSPQSYPKEVGYCWVTNSPTPSIAALPEFIDITFDIGGIAI